MLVKEEIREETSEIYEMMQGEGWPDLIFGKLFAVLGGIPRVGTVPKIINAVYKAFSDSDSFDKRSPLAYAAFAQRKLLGRRREDIDVSV